MPTLLTVVAIPPHQDSGFSRIPGAHYSILTKMTRNNKCWICLKSLRKTWRTFIIIIYHIYIYIFVKILKNKKKGRLIAKYSKHNISMRNWRHYSSSLQSPRTRIPALAGSLVLITVYWPKWQETINVRYAWYDIIIYIKKYNIYFIYIYIFVYIHMYIYISVKILKNK